MTKLKTQRNEKKQLSTPGKHNRKNTFLRRFDLRRNRCDWSNLKNTTKMKNETLNKTEVLSFAYAIHKNFLDIAGENIENYQKTSIDETVMKKFYLDQTQKYLHKGQAILKMIDYLHEQK